MNERFIDRCDYLFLKGIVELGGNGLRLLVREGLPAGAPRDVVIAGHTFHDCTPIKIMAKSSAFEIVWEYYVAYSVLNESFVGPSGDEEVYTGKRFRVYSKSRFRQYILGSTFATDEYPGQMQHYQVLCEDHVINVISTGKPKVTAKPTKSRMFRWKSYIRSNWPLV